MEDAPAYEAFDSPFASFEWDEDKRQINIAKHGIDFRQVPDLFEQRLCRRRSDQNGEMRFLVVGVLNDVEISIVYTEREEGVCRIISARRARPEERRAYRSLYARGD
ncbi:MAG: BrnT family toxin [Parvibaculum sp.]|uniref:BrnT family toxin n=1 Tax=Parvibaculum sp. TaxID=2024848 RepID=UPI0027188F57|nr:BrnT family toxin [Parvibaculum sp.]MDO8839897.1 BrnT family toxin [Parvibaculum sp.]